MSFSVLIAFDLAIVLAVISPGPAFLLAAKTGLQNGWRAGVLIALGLAIGGCSWMLASLLGVSLLFEIAPWSRIAIKILGAGYLIYLAIGVWKNAAKPIESSIQGAGSRYLWRGFATNALNPKAPLFTTAIVATILPSATSGLENAVFIANQFVIEAGWYALVALVLSAPLIRARYFRIKAPLDRTVAVLLGGLGLGFLVN